MKKFLTFILIAALTFALIGCGKSETGEVEETGNETAVLAGVVDISGSTSVEKIGVAIAEEFMALNPETKVTYESIGSSSGIKNANDGVTKIGASSRSLKDAEKAWGLTEVIIAYDGVAVVVNPANGVENLTVEQVRAIYKGEITNWSEVGGENNEIVVVSREDGSGTRGAFEEIVGYEGELTSKALIAEGNGNVQTTVATNPQAIGFISFSTIDSTIKPLKINDAEATPANVLAEKYPVARPFIMMYNPSNIDEVSKAYLDFALSAEGQSIVEKNGGIKVK